MNFSHLLTHWYLQNKRDFKTTVETKKEKNKGSK